MTTQPTKGPSLQACSDAELIAEVERRYKTLPLFVGEFCDSVAAEDCKGRTWVKISDTPGCSEFACKQVADAAKVYHTTGLTPSELDERMTALYAACGAALGAIKIEQAINPSFSKAWESIEKALRDALYKAKGGAA